MASASFAVDDARPLADVLALAVAQAGLSIDDEPVERAQRALSQELFVNAYTMRFKRQRTGDWDWLQKEPFRIPMCLADLIGHCLDQKQDAVDFDAAAAAVANLSSNAALKFLLGDNGAQPQLNASPIESALLSPGSATAPATTAPSSSGPTPTLAAIRLGQLDGGDFGAGEPALDFARHLNLLDDEGEVVVADKRSRSESPRRRSISKTRQPASKRSRSSRAGKPTARLPVRPAVTTTIEPSPAPVMEIPVTFEKVVSPLKIAKRDLGPVRDGGRGPRRSGRDSSLVRAMTNMLKHFAEPHPFSIEMIRAVPLLEDDQSSYESYSSDNSASEVDDEGRRPRRNTRSMPSKDDGSPNDGSADPLNGAVKRREVDRSRFDPNIAANGTSPKRKRINYSSDR